MGDEVTKKDLQSLQGYCNKQIADAEKRSTAALKAAIDSVNKALQQETEGINKTIENVQQRVR